MKKWTVYKHTAPSGKVYIGITSKRPTNRWNTQGQGYKSNKHFWNAIQKYGWSNFSHEIVAEDLTAEEAGKLEQQLIAEYDSANPEKGYNAALGGQHGLLNPQARVKISSAQKQVWQSTDYKQKRSAMAKQMWDSGDYREKMSGANHWGFGKHRPEETKEKIGATRRERSIPSPTEGKHLSEETKAKISSALQGNHNHTAWTEEERKRMSEARKGEGNPNYGKPMHENSRRALLGIHNKAVIQVLSNGTEVVYESAASAEEKTGVAACNISRTCRGQRKTAGGFVWRFANNPP